MGSAYGQVVIDSSGVRTGVESANRHLEGLNKGLGRVAKVGAAALATTAAAVGGIFVALTGVAASGVRMSMQLEEQMSGVKAVMQIADDQVQRLRDHVLELGVDPKLKVSAMQAAGAIEMLGRNGLNTTQILDGAARSTILLSNATAADFSQAADIATDVMALFNIRASEMETAVDGVTSVVNNSKFSITDYQYALAQAGGVATTSGVSFDDFNTAIAAMAPLFASGGSAGAGFKTMLQRMANPTGEMAQVMKELNLMSAEGKNLFYDEAGAMKSMSDVARLLHDNMAGLTDEQKNQSLAILFGTRSVNAAAGLMKYGATVTLTAAEAMEIFAVSQEEANEMIARGITEFDMLQAAMGNTSAAAAAAARMDNLAGSLEILKGVVETLRIRIGDVFNKDIRNAVNGLTQFLANNADRIVAIFAAVRTFAVGLLNVVKSFWGGLTGAMSGTLGNVEKNANGWGRNIVMSLARGMAAAATAVIRVLNSIGNAITRLLRPGSPPLLLPEIDEWGTGTIDAWLSGFNSADFSIFNQLANTVESYLRNITPEGDATLIERLLGSREAIADIVRQIRETGEVAEGVFDQLQEATGPLPVYMRDYAEALFEAEAAAARLSQAQQRMESIRRLSAETAVTDVRALADAYGGELGSRISRYADALQNLQQANARVTAAQQELNRVTERYDALLAPLNAQLRAIGDKRQDMRDAERMAELEAIIADDRLSASERQLAMMELEEIQLRKQIRDTEREKETAVDAEKEKLKAAEEAAAAAKLAAEEQQAAALALAEAELEAAQAQESAAKERLEVAKYMLDAQEKQNDLLREQMSLLAGLVDAIGGMGDAFKDSLGGLGGSDSILGDIENSLSGFGSGFEKAAEDVDAAADDMTSTIEQLVADIEAEFAPMNEAAENLGTTWGTVANTISERWQQLTGKVTGENGRLRQSLDGMRSWFNTNRGPITAFADETFGNLGRKLLDVGEKIRDFALAQLRKFGEWLDVNRPLLEGFAEKVGFLVLAFVDFSTKAQAEMTGLWDVVSPLLDGFISLLLNVATQFLQIVDGDWAGAWETMKEIPGIVWEAIKKATSAFLDWVTGWFGTDWQTVTEQWRANWELAKQIVALAWEAMKTKVEELWTAIKTYIIDKLQELFKQMGLDLDDMQVRWETIWTDVQLIAERIVELIRAFVEEKVEALKEVVIEKIQALQDWWEPKWQAIHDFLSDIWAEVLKAATEKVEEVYTAVTEKVQEIADWVDGKINEFYDLGVNIITALKDGALSMAGDLISAITGGVEDAIQAAKRLLGIASPSKVFTDMGKMSGQGFVVGVESMRQRLQQSMSNMLTPALSSAQRYASLLSTGSVASLAYASARPTPAGNSSSTEHYHFYGPITVEPGSSGGDVLREFKKLAGRG